MSRRVAEHETGAIPKANTHSRRPVQLVWVGEFHTHEEAFAFERQIKSWSHAKKKALVDNDWRKIHQNVKDEREKRKLKKRNENT